MTPHEFKKRLKRLGLSSTSKAAEQLAVSRHAVMHWKAGRRAIPRTAIAMLDAIERQRQLEFLS